MLVVGIELLDDHDARPVLFDHFNYTIVQGTYAPGHVGRRLLFAGTNDAGLADARAARRGFENAIAGNLQAGIDAEDSRKCSHTAPRLAESERTSRHRSSSQTPARAALPILECHA